MQKKRAVWFSLMICLISSLVACAPKTETVTITVPVFLDIDKCIRPPMPNIRAYDTSKSLADDVNLRIFMLNHKEFKLFMIDVDNTFQCYETQIDKINELREKGLPDANNSTK